MPDYNDLRETAIVTAVIALTKMKNRLEYADEESAGKDSYYAATLIQSVVKLLDHCDVRNKLEEIERRIYEVNSQDNLNEMVIDLRPEGRLKKTEGGKYILGKPKSTSLARKE